MKESLSVFLLIAAVLVAAGCGKKSNPVSPQSGTSEFPPDTSFSLTLYSPSLSVAVGESFEVRVILYNAIRVSGMALEMSFPSGNVDILGVTAGSSFFPPDSVISISRVESDSGRISSGVSYKNTASGASKSGSGIICTVQCKAKASGVASFVIMPNSVVINAFDGTLINNFASLLLKDLSVTIH